MSPKTPFEQGVITFTVMLVAIIEVLDMTIVNVALPPMMGSLGATRESITWVLTAYIIAAAVCMPLTGVLIERIGQKRLLLLNIVGFLFASLLCGVASSLHEMVFYRLLQGLFGASLVPLSQFILKNTFSTKDYGKAMAIWGMGIMVAPVLGPTLGGYITESLSWRWIFFINLPICCVALLLTYRFIDHSPLTKRPIDVTGLVLMVIAIGALQLFLDQGQSHDWLNSSTIVALLFTCLISGGAFIKRSWQHSTPIIRLHLFKDTIFRTSTVMVAIYTCGLLGMLALQPMMLEQLMGYSAKQAGLIMAPRGLCSALTMGLTVSLMKRFEANRLLALGLVCSFIGTYLMSGFTLNTTRHTMMMVGALQGVGMGLFFVPISTIAFTTLASSEIAEATGLFSFGRSLGSSIGIAILSTTISRQWQFNLSQVNEKITPFAPAVKQWLASSHLSQQQNLALLQQRVAALASSNAFANSFLLASLFFLCLLPLSLLLTPKKHSACITPSA